MRRFGEIDSLSEKENSLTKEFLDLVILKHRFQSPDRQHWRNAPCRETLNEEAKRLIDHLSDQATLNDIMYELYVKQKIQAGLQAAKEGRTIPHDEVKRRLLNRAD